MPIEFREEATHNGVKGITIMTFSIRTFEDAAQNDPELPKGVNRMSFAESIRTSQHPYIRFPNTFSGTEYRVTFDELTREYPEADFEKSFLSIDTRFIPDKYRNLQV